MSVSTGRGDLVVDPTSARTWRSRFELRSCFLTASGPRSVTSWRSRWTREDLTLARTTPRWSPWCWRGPY